MPGEPVKQVLKFDANARGFKRAAFLLFALAAATLLAGAYFLFTLPRP